MKKFYALVFGLTLFGQLSFANGWYYLGGAYNLPDCQVRAGNAGYAWAHFGQGWDAYGTYYPYWNACFGSGVRYVVPIYPVYPIYPIYPIQPLR